MPRKKKTEEVVEAEKVETTEEAVEAGKAEAEAEAVEAEKVEKVSRAKKQKETKAVKNVIPTKNPTRIAGEVIEFGGTKTLTAKDLENSSLMEKIRHGVKVGSLEWV